MAEDWEHGGFGLYVHWPFCQAKCPYCDFNSHVQANVDQSRWATALVDEINRIGAETHGRRLDSVFFGGGTPSLMEPQTVLSVLNAARQNWTVANDWEVTLEANPTSVEADRFRGFRDAGVNRISMGIQALNNQDLRKLGRLHSVEEARAAFGVARDIFDKVSFDLIYARQDQSLESWVKELKGALSMAIDHLSLYQLTIETGTAFGDRYKRGGLRGLPDEDLAAELYEATVEICTDAGMPLYEVSNFARPGAECRHNMLYWNYGDYAGVGPGAHGRLTLNGTKFATEASRNPGLWLSQVEAGQIAQETRDEIAPHDMAEEMLMVGLRTVEGVDLNRMAALGYRPDLQSKISRLQSDNLVTLDGSILKTTPQGRLLLNGVLRELLSD